MRGFSARNPFESEIYMPATRRDFLQTSLAAATLGALSASDATAIEPIHRTGRPLIRLSLAAYSFRQYLDLRRGPSPR